MAANSNHASIGGSIIIVLALIVFLVYMFIGNSEPPSWMARVVDGRTSESCIRSTAGFCACKTEANTAESYNNTYAHNLATPLPTVDFEAPCDVRSVITSLYDTRKPLTSSDIALLRGCMVLLFFRNPRCATTSIYFLMNELSKALSFESMLGNPKIMKPKLGFWVDYINNATKNRRRIVLSMHKAALNVTSGVTKSPVIFNLNRHPIDHLVSIFKLKKYGGRAEDDSQKPLRRAGCNISFEAYVMTHGLSTPCLNDMFMGLRYLCGPCKDCTREMCVSRAKRNLDTVYLVVGLSENIPAFLFVMETLLPAFFHGALEKYVHMSGLYQMFRADPGRDEPLSDDTVRHLRTLLAPDIELYHYVKARFYVALKKVLEYRADNNLTDSSMLNHHRRPPATK